MILMSVKLCTSETRAQKHEWESSSSPHVAYFIFSHAKKWPLFCLKRGKKIPFLWYTRKMSIRSFHRDYFAVIVGFYNDEVVCPYFQVFATNLPSGSLDGDIWWSKKWRKITQLFPHMRKLLIISTVNIDKSRIFRVYSKKGIFFPRFMQKRWPFLCMHEKKIVIDPSNLYIRYVSR